MDQYIEEILAEYEPGVILDEPIPEGLPRPLVPRGSLSTWMTRFLTPLDSQPTTGSTFSLTPRTGLKWMARRDFLHLEGRGRRSISISRMECMPGLSDWPCGPHDRRQSSKTPSSAPWRRCGSSFSTSKWMGIGWSKISLTQFVRR